MRISDWSSDVCSSDLGAATRSARHLGRADAAGDHTGDGADRAVRLALSRVEQGRDLYARLGSLDQDRACHLVGPVAHHHLPRRGDVARHARARSVRSEEHTSELQSLMRISYAIFCLKKKNSYLHLQNTI